MSCRERNGSHQEAIEYLHRLAAGILPDPSSLKLHTDEGAHEAVRLILQVDSSQRCFLIGRGGTNYNAMSTLIRAFSRCVGVRYVIEIMDEDDHEDEKFQRTERLL